MWGDGCQRLPIRGGNWNNGGGAGVFALNCNNVRSNANSNIGARPALGDRQIPAAHAAAGQYSPKRSCHPRRGRGGILNRRAAPVSLRADRPAPPPFCVGVV